LSPKAKNILVFKEPFCFYRENGQRVNTAPPYFSKKMVRRGIVSSIPTYPVDFYFLFCVFQEGKTKFFPQFVLIINLF